jgi:hypothetical protein
LSQLRKPIARRRDVGPIRYSATLQRAVVHSREPGSRGATADSWRCHPPNVTVPMRERIRIAKDAPRQRILTEPGSQRWTR